MSSSSGMKTWQAMLIYFLKTQRIVLKSWYNTYVALNLVVGQGILGFGTLTSIVPFVMSQPNYYSQTTAFSDGCHQLTNSQTVWCVFKQKRYSQCHWSSRDRAPRASQHQAKHDNYLHYKSWHMGSGNKWPSFHMFRHTHIVHSPFRKGAAMEGRSCIFRNVGFETDLSGPRLGLDMCLILGS